MREIYCQSGATIDGCFRDMKRFEMRDGNHCFAMFNGKKLLSTYTLDECYKIVTGVTKKEFEEKRNKEREKYLREEEEFKSSIPEKIKEYQQKAIGVIPKERIPYWNKIVPIRLNDLYRGMELDALLEIIVELNKDFPQKEKFEKCKEIFLKQGHSGMSSSLVFSGLEIFHPLGTELVKFIKNDW